MGCIILISYTTKLNLKKPSQTDFYNLQYNNDNMDIIDEHASSISSTSVLGHCKISDSIKGTSMASTGIVASEYAVGFLAKVVFGGLEALTWEEINDINMSGMAQTYFKIGDTKTVKLLNNEVVTLVLADFNHDILTSGGTASMTFIVKNCLIFTDKRYMNSTNINNTSWNTSYMRGTVIAEILAQLPTDLKNMLKFVNKATTAGNQSISIVTTSDKLWLPSCIEIGLVPASSDGYINEGSQYPIFTDSNSRIKLYNSTSSMWWLRSPNTAFADKFMAISDGGALYATGFAGTTRGVVIGLCI